MRTPRTTKAQSARRNGHSSAPSQRAKGSSGRATRRRADSTIRNLVIVESPAKARTLANILGRDYTLKASVGHVRDLPKSKLGVDVEHGFAPQYLIPKEKRPVINEIKEAAKRAEQVYLATDPDREGEAISWHLVHAVGLDNVPHKRVIFHEITPEAIRAAFEHPRDIDMRLVDAQQARRVLDRLVGYRLSPVLWSKIRRGLSAGRVQSVALRMVVEREREIQNFVPREYWSIDALLSKATDGTAASLRAQLQGPLKGRKKDFSIPDQATADELLARLRQAAYTVEDVRKRPQTRKPSPPFTTSTLQQEASRKLGMSPARTMALAQELYEGVRLGSRGETGLITYMRTDSTNVAQAAVAETRDYIRSAFGKEYVPASPRAYRTKTKGAQEAHEAIRPTSVQRTPDAVRAHLSRDLLRLYTLIWQRMVASQMADAVYDSTSVDIRADTTDGDAYLFRATASVLRFAGFRRVYIEATDDGDEDSPAEATLPELAKGERLSLQDLVSEQHFTQPPPRFTEASLVKALEENGIGRPSTYAPIMQTLRTRGYVRREGNRLFPEELGFVVNDLLTANFPDIVDVGFTADMEDELDDVASGERSWEPVVREFYGPLEQAVGKAQEAPPVTEVTDIACPNCGRPLARKWGRFGQFLACTGYPECRHTQPLEAEAEAQAQEAEGELCDICGAPMTVKTGRFGRFLACSRYPECKGTRSLAAKVGVPCPLDGGDIVEKRTRRGRVFYGCNNYPRCEFTSWSRPLPGACPDCGSLIVQVGRGENAKCTNCEWKGKPTEQREAVAAGT